MYDTGTQIFVQGALGIGAILGVTSLVAIFLGSDSGLFVETVERLTNAAEILQAVSG